MNITIQFSEIACCNCGFVFAVPATVKTRWTNEHTSFYCPSCKCSQSYLSKSEKEMLQAKMVEYKKAYEEKLECCVNLQSEVEHQKNRVNGYKGFIAKAKLKNKS